MNDTTWVKLYRKSLGNHIRRHDPTAWRLFETLLLLVDSNTGKWAGGRYQLVEADGYLNGSTIYKALKRLEDNEMISVNSNTKYTEIYICNFGQYAKAGNTSSNNKVTTNEQRSNTLTRIKNKELIYMSSSAEKNVLDVLNEVTGRNFRNYPDEKRTRQTIKTFTIDEIRKALDNMKRDQWHKERIGGLSAGYLLATQNIDKFLNYKTATDGYVKRYEKAVPFDERAALRDSAK